jgi:hypothetical protein
MRSSTTLQPDDGGQRSAPMERGPVRDNDAQAAIADGSPRIAAQRSVAAAIQNSPRVLAGHERRQALTGGGLPAQLKAGVEALSGLSMDAVRVHYNSARPAQLRAHAYAQGADIHLGPGQERHLPHEAWHVVQQAQGRVRPTIQAKGLPVNDDEQLEREADRMGALALRTAVDETSVTGGPTAQRRAWSTHGAAALQRADGEDDADMIEEDDKDSTHVGVQLGLDYDGNIANLLVAGRPASPFSGSMGDHVTAFGVHVANLRSALAGASLDDGYARLKSMAEQIDTLPGMAYLSDDAANGKWGGRRENLGAALAGWVESDDTDVKLARLQWAAALYLEVREGVPLSLVNTRYVSADSGRGRGEAGHLDGLSTYLSGEPAEKAAKIRKRGKGAVPARPENFVLGLFDEDAAAMLTFRHQMRSEQTVGALVPGHASAAKLLDVGTEALMALIAEQHVASVFSSQTDTEIPDRDELEKAVLDKLVAAHERRRTKDVSHWNAQLNANAKKLGQAVAANDTFRRWADQYASPAAWDLLGALQLIVKLADLSVPEAEGGEPAGDEAVQDKASFVKDVGVHADAVYSELDTSIVMINSLYIQEATPLIKALMAYYKAATLGLLDFRDCLQRAAAPQAASSGSEPVAAPDYVAKLYETLDDLRAALTALGVARALAAKALGKEADTGSADDDAMQDNPVVEQPTGSSVTPDAPGIDSQNATMSAPMIAPMNAPSTTATPLDNATMGVAAANADVDRRTKRLREEESKQDIEDEDDVEEVEPDEKIEQIFAGIFGATGNAFTVALRLKSDRTIANVSLRGRPPSPFQGTMGAHTTAWLVWVNAVVTQLTGLGLDDAGKRLVRFAAYLVRDAQANHDDARKAQNAARRDESRWDDTRLDAWATTLATFHPDEGAGWSLDSVQAYARAILTFANQVPGTTRADKNTDGHGESTRWKAAKAMYATEDGKQAALKGPGLFDGGSSSSARKRHEKLMALALNHTNLDAGEFDLADENGVDEVNEEEEDNEEEEVNEEEEDDVDAVDAEARAAAMVE